MKKFFRILGILLLALFFLGTIVFLWLKGNTRTQTYQLISPQIRTIEKSIIATGKVEPSNEVQIKPQTSGIIDTIYYVPGDDVKVGDVIAKIKVVPEMSSLNNAEGRLRVATINFDKALKDHQRNTELFGKGILSQEEFETSQSVIENARAEVSNAKAALDIITNGVSEKYNHLSNTLIRSTITGKILEIPIEIGNSVIQANTFNNGTTIAYIADLRKMLFKGHIDESDIDKVNQGMPAKVKIGALQDVSFDAMLTYISPKSKEVDNIVMFEIEAELEIPDSIFVRVGYSANAEIITDKRDCIITIEESCVKFSGDTSYVEIFKGIDKNEQVFERRAINIGISNGVYVEVLDGLTKDDKVKGNLHFK